MRRALDSASLFPLLFGLPVTWSLADAAAVVDKSAPPANDVPEIKWIHVATTGMYRGHWQGEFDLTRPVFESFVKNLRAHPQYTPGEITLGDKKITAGTKPTIQYDYEHVSEMSPTEGMVAKLGAEAPAWVLDLEIRDAGQESQLWALSWLGEQIRDQIKRNAYRQTSIAFDMESTDWRTGEPSGPCLTSIAFTNRPFLRHLESYAAANRRTPRNSTQRASEPATPQRITQMTVTAAATVSTPNEALEVFKANICRRLGIRTLQDPAAIEDAVGDAGGTSSKLSTLLTALGVPAVDDALKVIPAMRDARQQLSDALAELDEMLQGQAAQDQQQAAADVSAVMSALKWPDSDASRLPLFAYHAACLTEAEQEGIAIARRKLGENARVPVTTRLAARREGRGKFLKTYGIVDGVDTSALSKTLLASKGGAQHPAPATPPRLPIADRTDGAVNGTGQVIDLSASKGRGNPTERVMTHLTATDPAFKTLSHYDKCKQASVFMQSNEINFG